MSSKLYEGKSKLIGFNRIYFKYLFLDTKKIKYLSHYWSRNRKISILIIYYSGQSLTNSIKNSCAKAQRRKNIDIEYPFREKI